MARAMTEIRTRRCGTDACPQPVGKTSSPCTFTGMPTVLHGRWLTLQPLATMVTVLVDTLSRLPEVVASSSSLATGASEGLVALAAAQLRALSGVHRGRLDSVLMAVLLLWRCCACSPPTSPPHHPAAAALRAHAVHGRGGAPRRVQDVLAAGGWALQLLWAPKLPRCAPERRETPEPRQMKRATPQTMLSRE